MMSPLIPLIAITLHHPQVDLQKLRPALEWAGRADLYLRPDRIERWSARNLGIEKPFDPGSLAQVGIDTAAPIKAMLPTERGPLILELAVKDAKKVDRLIASLETKAGPKPPVLVKRIDRRVVVVELVDRTRAEEELARAESVVRPKKGKGPLTIEVSDYEPIEHALIEVELAQGKIEAEGRASLSLAARLLANDFLGEGSARRYLASLGPIAEISGTAGPGAIREALVEAGMTVAEADAARKLLSGEHAVALTKDGMLAGVARLSGSASKKAIDAFVERLKASQPGIEVRALDGYLLGWFPGSDPKATIDLSADRLQEAPKAEAPLELRIDPRALIGALRRRGRTRIGPSVHSAHLTIFEALFENLLRKTTSGQIVARKARGELKVSAVIRYE